MAPIPIHSHMTLESPIMLEPPIMLVIPVTPHIAGSRPHGKVCSPQNLIHLLRQYSRGAAE